MIPRIIHQMWIGSETPVEYLGYAAGWRALHPGWEYMWWDERMGGKGRMGDYGLFNEKLWDGAHAISPRAIWQYRSDIARYEILHKYGGVWVDMDMMPQKSIDPLMIDVDGWAAWEEPGKWINNAMLACVPGYKVMENIIKGLPARSAWPGANTVKSGPQYITPHLLAADRFMVWPKQYFYPYLWNELEREDEEHPNAYAVHRWNNRRRRK